MKAVPVPVTDSAFLSLSRAAGLREEPAGHRPHHQHLERPLVAPRGNRPRIHRDLGADSRRRAGCGKASRSRGICSSRVVKLEQWIKGRSEDLCLWTRDGGLRSFLLIGKISKIKTHQMKKPDVFLQMMKPLTELRWTGSEAGLTRW